MTALDWPDPWFRERSRNARSLRARHPNGETTISSTELHTVVRDQLAGTRQRYTSGRRDLVELLAGLDRPATIPELLDGGAAQSQSSLYRNLAVLEQCNVVRRLASMDDVARWELSEELTEHHHHLTCGECGRVDDVVLPARIEQALAEAAVAAREQRGYRIDTHHLELVGTCRSCTEA